MIRVNPLALIDAYKADHVTQYIDGTEEIYSNMTPRSNKYAKSLSPHMSDKVVHFNLQGLLIAYVTAMNEQFFNLPKDVAINQYRRRMDKVFGKGVINTKHIENLHDLGYLPLFIKSLPEGSLVNMKIPVMTIRNTLPEFSWMVNHIESMLSNMLWKSSTVATISYSFKRLLYSYAVRTGTDLASVDYQLHDFSYRGTTGTDDACFVGAGHLTSFLGSDTIPASEYIEDYYCFTEEDKDVSYSSSIPATEHSVMSLGIGHYQGKDTSRQSQLDAERELFKELLTVKYPTGPLAIVSDTFNLWDVLTKVVPSLKDEILARENGKLVCRPDSGDPVKIITGYRVYECDSTTSGMTKYSIIGAMSGITKSHYEAIKMNGLYWKIDKLDEQLTEEEIKGGVELLWETFGGTLQTGSCGKEYKLLDSHIGMIYGDSITLERADQILTRLADKGFASGNVVLGVGSFSYQMLSRDTYGYAMKATNAVVRDSGIALFKDPITDNGVKKSAQGLLRVEKVSDNSPEGYSYVVYEKQTEEQEKQGELKPIFKDGQFVNLTSFQQVKDNISHALNN